MKNILKTLLPSLFLLLGLCTASAQTTPAWPYSTDNNGINEADLATPVTIPICSKDGRGIGIDAKIIFYPYYWAPYVDPTTGQSIWAGGGQLVLPKFGLALSHMSNQRAGLCNSKMMVEQSFFYFYDFEGNQHGVGIDVFQRGAPCGYPTIFDGYADDQSGYHVHYDADGICAIPCSITAPDGTIVGGVGYNPYPNEPLTDPNGNQITTVTNNGVATVTDTLGHSVLTVSGGNGQGTDGTPTVYTYHGPSGDRSVTIHYTHSPPDLTFSVPTYLNHQRRLAHHTFPQT